MQRRWSPGPNLVRPTWWLVVVVSVKLHPPCADRFGTAAWPCTHAVVRAGSGECGTAEGGAVPVLDTMPALLSTCIPRARPCEVPVTVCWLRPCSSQAAGDAKHGDDGLQALCPCLPRQLAARLATLQLALSQSTRPRSPRPPPADADTGQRARDPSDAGARDASPKSPSR